MNNLFQQNKAFENWQKDKKKREQSKAPVRPLQFEDPRYIGKSEGKKTYKWETETLKPLSVKQYGRSYDDKFESWAKSQGIKDHEMASFRSWMDSKEDGVQIKGSALDKSLKHSVDQQKAELPKFMEEFNKRSKEVVKKNDVKAQIAEKAKPEEKKAGERDGILGFLDRYVAPISKGATEVLAPGNQDRMKKIQEDKYGRVTNPITKAVEEDRGTETKVLNTAGALAAYVAPYGQAYKAADVAFNKVPKLSKIANPYVQKAIKGAAAGGVAEAGLSAENELVNPDAYDMRDYAIRTGLGVAGGAVLDPALYGAGRALNKGFETAAEKAMKDLVPSNEQTAKGFADGLKMNQSDNVPIGDFPNISNRPNAAAMQELIPNATERLSPFNARPDLSPKVPKIGQRVDELPPIKEEDFTLADRAEYFSGQDRPLPDYSTAKPVVETYDGYNQYGVQEPVDLVEQAPPEYWQGRYNAFVEHVQQNYDTNELTQEAIEDLWSQFARYDEPVTLEQVVDLAYSNYQEPKTLNAADAWDQMSNRPPVSQNAKRILGVDNADRKVNNNLAGDLSVNREPAQVSNPLEEVAATKAAVGNAPLLPVKGNFNPKELVYSNQSALDVVEGMNRILPKMDSEGLKPRGHIETLRNSENASEGLRERLTGAYKPVTNEDAVNMANQQIGRGLDNAVSFVKSAKKLEPQHVATAHRLIQEFQNSGQIEKAVDIAEHIAEQGTKAGQAVQAFSIFDRLSPEGILVHAQRVADRVNARLNPLKEKVTITADTANKLTDLASSVQRMTENSTIANDVISLMDKAKSGVKLADDEIKVIRQFYDDARQFVQDIAPKKGNPKPPKKIVNQATKERVISFLDQQEAAARKRLAQRRNRALSGLPVDDFYDYTVIGAAKLAKGTVHFAEFSEQMIREFGEEIAPYVHQIYDKASEMVNNEAKRSVNRLPEVQRITEKAIKNGKVDANEAENLRKFALSISKMSGEAKLEASQELQAVLQLLERPSLLQQVSSAQTIAQLLNPKTLVRNALGNELFYRLERINKMVAAPIDWARVKTIGGQRTVSFRTNNQGEYWKNWMKGAKAGWKGVNPGGLSTQYDIRPNSFNGKWNPLTYLEKTLGVALKSFDYAGYKRAVNNTIGELATLRAMNEGLTGTARKQAIEKYIREADENILAIADEYGRYVTFQDNNIFSVGLQRLKRGLNLGQDFGMGDLIIKYPRTPGSLLMRALEYSPAGFLKSAYTFAKPFYNKNFSWQEATESFTRALIGTAGVSGVAWFLADKGIVTGTGGKDFDVMELERMAGKSEYSINADALVRWVMTGFNPEEAETKKGDRFLTYNWALPISTSISIGANIQRNIEETGEVNIGNTVYGAADGALDTMVEQSVLHGVKQAFESYPGQSVGDKLVDIAGDLPSSFVPTALNQVRQLTDNTGRNTYDPSKLKTYGNRALNKVPYFEKKLPPAYDTLGNKKEVYQDESNNIFNVLLNPAFVRRYNPSPEAEMVLDIINQTGDTTVAPRRAQKYLIIDGARYDLSSEEYSEYQRRLGEAVRYELQDLLPNAGSDPEKLGKEVNKILDRVGRQVREELKQEFR